MEQDMAEFRGKELANIAWAFATLGLSDAVLFDSLARAGKEHMDDLKKCLGL